MTKLSEEVVKLTNEGRWASALSLLDEQEKEYFKRGNLLHEAISLLSELEYFLLDGIDPMELLDEVRIFLDKTYIRAEQ